VEGRSQHVFVGQGRLAISDARASGDVGYLPWHLVNLVDNLVFASTDMATRAEQPTKEKTHNVWIQATKDAGGLRMGCIKRSRVAMFVVVVSTSVPQQL